ncbi:MAG: alpha-xylosidase, partial [Prevotella sp.]|nr:alpha-xylosidase [Prevotella sp.]
FQLKNQDGQGVNNRRCYKNIPFYMSSRMYGVFYHTSDYCKLSLADHSSRSVQFMCDRATIDAFLIGGKTPEEILHNYRKLTGFPSMPPLWSYGIWMSRMTYFSAEEVNDICDHLRKEHYPCDVIHLDTGWFRTDWLCEWKFNPERFPDPKGFIQDLKKKGFRVSLWQLPYVAKGAEQLEEAKANQYIAPLLKEQASEGSNFSALDYAGTIDFTYDKAVEWYKKKLLKPLLDMGVTCIKTDFGENIHLDAVYHSMTPEQLNNLYALLYQKAAFEITKEVTGDGIIWARAAWAGCQRFPLHWGGDSASSWDGMAGSLKGGLHFGLSGFAFWSHDVPGFHSIPDFMNSPINPQVYVRWTQFGVFTSHIRYHGTCKREPWHYPEIAPIIKRWWKLRYRLIPYIIQQSEMACQSGLPIVQALIFHHPDDRQCWHIDDEYYFGNEFLVCPVMNDKGIRDIYLPDGEWINFFTGERMEGGKWYDAVKTPLDLMPVFVHPNATIPIYPYDVDCTDDMELPKAINLEITDNYIGYKL